MKYAVERSSLSGEAIIPGSKSHTVRAVFFASLSEGECEVARPLDSADTRSAVAACRALGATISSSTDRFIISGNGGNVSGIKTEIDTGNSGTTTNIAAGVSALARDSVITLTGDDQIRRRPIGSLVDALNNLGADAECLLGNGCPPVRISRPMKGGRTTLRAPNSQFLTSLLISAPLAEGDTEIEVLELNERPYVAMTLWWLDRLGIRYEREGYERFQIPGGQKVNRFSTGIPGDFSSATFFAVAAAVTGSRLLLRGLDVTDVQGDKAVLDIVKAMGADVRAVDDGIIVEGRGGLKGGEFDLNDTPDALPALAVAACAADGITRLTNVPQARIKETDRIAVMAAELGKMGADVREEPDGLVIRGGGGLRGADVDGHGDHRVVMALAVAGLIADGRTVISTAESVGITFPNFAELMTGCGASLNVLDN